MKINHIVLGVTTYNRKEILQKSLNSLRQSGLDERCVIKIYDDSSNDMDKADLCSLVPEAESIYVQPHNLGSDANIRYMYADFVNCYSENDVFFNADSDLIYTPGWIDISLSKFESTDGVLSIFNAPSHRVLTSKGDMIIKEDVGSAGTLFSWEVLNDLLPKIPQNDLGGFDYQWSRKVRQCGMRLFCLKKSLVQHIGIDGYNSDLARFDYGLGFKVGTVQNGQIINDVLAQAVQNQRNGTRRFWYALFPFDKVPKGARVVLYGAGEVARDYLAQLKKQRYCDVVAIVDGKKAGEVFDAGMSVMPREKLLSLAYDCIVLSVREPATARSINADLAGLDSSLPEKTIYAGADSILRI